MTYEELLGSIEAAAAERKRELREKAVLESEGIRRAAGVRAAGMREEAMARAREKAAAERARMLGLAREEARMDLLKRRNELFGRAFAAVEVQVRSLRGSPSERPVARRLAGEALGLAGGSDLLVHVDPRDRALFEGILGELGRNCEIATDINGAGGLVVTSRDGRFLVTNTLESRLLRARALLKEEVFSLLSGG